MLTPEQARDRLPALVDHVVRLTDAADLDAPVPSCPDWSARDLIVHLGNVHRWVVQAMTTGNAEDPLPAAAPDHALASWYRGVADEMLELFAATDPLTPCWTFGMKPRRAAFWFRRQAQEVGDPPLGSGGRGRPGSRYRGRPGRRRHRRSGHDLLSAAGPIRTDRAADRESCAGARRNAAAVGVLRRRDRPGRQTRRDRVRPGGRPAAAALGPDRSRRPASSVDRLVSSSPPGAARGHRPVTRPVSTVPCREREIGSDVPA